MTFTFNDKTSYLTYRKEWAARYLDQINAMRAAKQEVRDANRVYAKNNKEFNRLWQSYYTLRDAHQNTIKLLEELWAAKVEAGRQMAAISHIQKAR